MPHRPHWPERRIQVGRWLLAGGMTAALIATPLTAQHDSFGVVWQTALARGPGGGPGDGPGGGPGSAAGGDHGRAGEAAGRGLGVARDAAGSHGQAGQEYGSFREFADSVRGAAGRSFGLGHRDAGLEEARARYAAALEHRRTGRAPHGLAASAPERQPGPPAYRFSPEETAGLIERGWRPDRPSSAGFRNHGERVRTMVELSKRLGYSAHVGALQANFGTPYETGIAELEAELAEARAELDANPEDPEAAAWVDQLEMELAAAIERAKPGQGPHDSWASADLDVNGDGVVDAQDLAALDADEGTMPAGYVDSSSER